MKIKKNEMGVKYFKSMSTVLLLGLLTIVVSCVGDEHAALSEDSGKVAEETLHAMDAQGKKIDIILLDESRCLLLGKQVEIADLAKKIAHQLGMRDGERVANDAVTGVISAGKNFKLGQVSDVQSVLRDLGIQRVKYLGRDRISPVLVF